MDEKSPRASQSTSALTRLLCPPLALVRTWKNPSTGWVRKTATTLGLLLYSVVYAVLLIALFVQAGCVSLEWQGGFPPVLTFHKTVPDYEALEQHRRKASQGPSSSKTNELAAASPGGTYWTGFRGPRRNGHYEEMPIRTDWPENGLVARWRQPIGGGYGSFAIVGGLAFTIEQRRELEAITAYDLLTGQEVWVHSYPARFEESMGGEGPRSTPTWDEGSLYALGAMGHFHCLEAKTGKVRWSHQLLDDFGANNLYFGCSASPLIVEDEVVVMGGEGGGSLFAFDKQTGALKWRSVNEQPSYMSPMLVTLAGQRQILAASAAHVMGLDAEQGQVLWQFPWEVQHDLTIAQPVLVSSNQFVLSAGYNRGAALVDITKNADGMSASPGWSNRFLKNKFTSSVFHEGYIYGLDESILTCLEAQTGRRQWKDGRYEYGQVLLASGHLVILSGRGELALVRATPEQHEEVAIFPAIEGKTWNHPAIGDGYLLVRNAVEMACFDVGVREGR